MDVSILIPARGGSTRLPGKNDLKLGSLSLVNIAAAQGRNIFPGARVYVSTNAPETAQRAFAEVINRPDELCTAESPTIAAVKHALGVIKSEWICLLQPDHPFRDVQALRQQVEDLELDNIDSVFTVVPFTGFLFSEDAYRMNYTSFALKSPRIRSQDMIKQFVETGEFYMFRRSVMYHEDFIFSRKKMIDGLNIMDIHTQDDYEIAKKLWSDSWLW